MAGYLDPRPKSSVRTHLDIYFDTNPKYREVTDPNEIRRYNALFFVQDAKEVNAKSRAHNRRLYIRLLVQWFSFVAGSFALGWSIWWIRRGFGPNR